MSFLETWEKITTKFPGLPNQSFELTLNTILDEASELSKKEKKFIYSFWMAMYNKTPFSTFLTKKMNWEWDDDLLNLVSSLWSKMMHYIDIHLFREQSRLLGRFFALSFQFRKKEDEEDVPQGAFIKKVKAKTRKAAFNVLGSRNMLTSFVYNPMISPIPRETIITKDMPPCSSSSSSTPLAPCRPPVSVAPLEGHPTEVIFKLLSSSRDEPIVDVACFSDYMSIVHKYVALGRVERAGRPYTCISYFFNQLLRDWVFQKKDAPTITLGSIPSKYYFDLTWLVAGKNRYELRGWRSIVQPPEKQDTSSSAPILAGIGYETYLDKFQEDFIMRMFLDHEKGDNYTILQIDILLASNPRDITWQTYLSSTLKK